MRIPSFLRTWGLSKLLFRMYMPKLDVLIGPFNFNFDGYFKKITFIHDLSFFKANYHLPTTVKKSTKEFLHSLKYSNKIVLISCSIKNELLSKYPQHKEKYELIYNLIPDYVHKSEHAEKINQILVVGTLEPRKNYSTIIKAYKLLIHECDSPPLLKIIGKKGWMVDSEIRDIEALVADRKCIFIDDASDADLYLAYAESRYFTYLSLYEGFGYPPFEAAQNNCLLLVSDRSAVGEIWNHYASNTVNPLDAENVKNSWIEMMSYTQDEITKKLSMQKARVSHFTDTNKYAESIRCILES